MLEVRTMLHHDGGSENDEDPVVNNGYFDKSIDLVDSPVVAIGGAAASVPLTSIPALHSHAGAPAKVYLNFLGDFTANWGSHTNITTPVFDTDGDPTTFSTTELTAINTIWAETSEDFSPFNIDVTTEDPIVYPHGVVEKVNIGGGGDWLGTPAGGVAHIGNFVSALPNIVFVFPDSLGRSAKNIGEASSHETGHAFGLQHQSTFDAAGIKLKEYNPGNGSTWAPIMGNSYAAAVSTWYNGQSSLGSTVLQDDMTVIASAANGFGYRPDDHPNTVGSGDPLTVTGNQVSASGVIEKMTDADAFSFTTDAGAITLSANVATIGPNLDTILELYNSSGSLVASANPSNSLSSTITTTVAAGNYTLLVKPTGVYGYVGTYTVSGQINTGMYVAAHTPAQTDVVLIPPLDFTITTSDPYQPASVDASDLKINSIPADSFTIVNANTIGFHFLISPVSNIGLQQMTIGAGGLTRASDDNLLKDFQDTFRYDPVPLTVASIEPTDNSIAQLPLTSLIVHFNEPIDPQSIGDDDLTLSRGTVTGFALTNDPTTVQYTIASLTTEGPLTVQLHGGVAADQYGNPNLAFSATLNLDYGTIPYPGAPLAPVAPLGSLIYDPGVSGTIGDVGDDDSFTVVVPAGQMISVVMQPSLTLQPQLVLLDPAQIVIGSVAASGAANSIVLGPVMAVAGGTYTIVASGVASTVGSYTATVTINAAVENETYTIVSNDTVATAQSIDASFVTLGSGLSRGGVVGRGGPPTGLLPAEIEPNNTTATASNATQNFGSVSASLYQLSLHGNVASNGDSDWFNIGALNSGDVITITESGSPSSRGTLSDAFVELYRAGTTTRLTFNDDSGSGGNDSLINRFTITTSDTYYIRGKAFSTRVGTYDLGVWLENTGAPPLTGGNATTAVKPDSTKATATDVSTSWQAVQYVSQTTGSTTVGDTDYFLYTFHAGDVVSLFLTSTSGNADNSVGIYNSANTRIGYESGASFPNDSNLYSFTIPTDGNYFVRSLPNAGTGDYQLSVYLSSSIAPPPPTDGGDDYAVTLAQGEHLSLALKNLVAGAVHVQIRDNADIVLVDGSAGSTNLAEAIQNFAAPVGGVYIVRVVADTNVDYSLVAMRGGVFDAEGNDATSGSHVSLDGGHGALGYINANTPSEFGKLGFTMDVAQSSIALGGTLGPLKKPLVEQSPGSLTAHYTGQLLVNRTLTQVQFPGGSTLAPVPQPGTFVPDVPNVAYAAQVFFSPSVPIDFAFSGVALDLTSALGSPTGGAGLPLWNTAFTSAAPISFPANTVLITLTAGDLNYQLDALGSGVYPMAGLALANQSTASGTLEDQGDKLHLTIPIDVTTSFSEPSTGLSITIHFAGQFVADYVFPGPIDPVDYYEVHLTAGQKLSLSTATPFDGISDIPANGVNPNLVVRDANGVLLATDDNSAADGKNAQLGFIAPATGIYLIGVGATSGHGEYVLNSSLDNPPVAFAGGPYGINQGQGLQFDASASSDPDIGDTLSYSWDLNGDGVFGDAQGAAPVLTWQQLSTLGVGPWAGSYNVKVRVNDNYGVSTDSATTSLTIHAVAPRVIGVSLVGGGSAHYSYDIPGGSGEQLRTVAVGVANQITIHFSSDVHVDQDDLTLTGQNAVIYSFSGFSYQSVSRTATWALTSPIGADQLTLTLNADGTDPVTDDYGNALDGEWDNPALVSTLTSKAFPSGNDSAGGDFQFRFNVLPGDLNRDGLVTGGDYTIWAANYGLTDGSATFPQGDLNDDGKVTSSDYTIWAVNYQSIVQTLAILPATATVAKPAVMLVTSVSTPTTTTNKFGATPHLVSIANGPSRTVNPLAQPITAKSHAQLAFSVAVDELMHALGSKAKSRNVRGGWN